MDKSFANGGLSVNGAFFWQFFSQMLQYALDEARKGGTLEQHLHTLGLLAGYKALPLLTLRGKFAHRVPRLVPFLTFVSKTLWEHFFGRQAKLMKSQDQEHEYFIKDSVMMLNQCLDVPPEFGLLNAAAFAAGFLQGVLSCAQFPARVSAHALEEGPADATIFLVRCDQKVVKREKALDVL